MQSLPEFLRHYDFAEVWELLCHKKEESDYVRFGSIADIV